MNTANKITILRIILIPIFMIVLYQQNQICSYIALGIFIIASITDSIDGHIARKYNQITNFGKFVDPLADKLLVASALIIFVEFKLMPAWAVFIIIARELIITILRVIAASQGKILAADKSGKIKTATQMITICVALFFAYTPFNFGGFTNITLIYIFTILSVLITIYSGMDYLINNREVISME